MKLSIILLTSDQYEELALENLEMLLNKFKNKVSYDVVLASSEDNLHKLNTEHKFVFDTVFSDRLIKALSKIETEYVMLWLDDYRIKNINFTLFEKCFHLLGIYFFSLYPQQYFAKYLFLLIFYPITLIVKIIITILKI